MKVEQNISRLRYLLSLYKMSERDLLSYINEVKPSLAKPITLDQIFSDKINLSHLKRVDKVFNKGLHFYLDPKSPEVSQDASIFFRKNKFGTDLNIGAKKIVNQFEELKISLSALAKLADINLNRTLPVYRLSDPPRDIANLLRKDFYPTFDADKRGFLKALIGKFAENNILVFEFIETWNKIEKANIDGFFLNPNVVVLKRQQTSFRREIFTLIHELGHFLLNEEEIEQLDVVNLASSNLSAVEKWCNDFAYFFLAGDFDNLMEKINIVDSTNDYHSKIIRYISENTHLSQIALYTRLLFQNKISITNYNKIKTAEEERFREIQEEEKKKRELERLQGIKQGGSTPKPINSPLLISTIQTAFYEGLINEFDVCKSLNISPDKLYVYLG